MSKPTISRFREFCKQHGELTLDYKPVDCGSWRGSYDEPCIFVELEEGRLSDFMPFLDELVSGKVFWGYKGGQYKYCELNEINIEGHHGSYSGEDSMIFDVLNTITNLRDEWESDPLVFIESRLAE
ncbi:hypothetical protein ACWKYH_06835 [Enterobacter sp. UPMP2076]